MKPGRLTLATMCGGAVQERVDRALERVARNILDPNTDQGKKRTITLKITFTPNKEDPEDVQVTTDVTTSLAHETGVSTRMYISASLSDDRVSVAEFGKGEMAGQLSFGDIIGGNGDDEGDGDRDFDPDTGEIYDGAAEGKVIDLRRAK